MRRSVSRPRQALIQVPPKGDPKRDLGRRHPASTRDREWAVARPTSHLTATHSQTLCTLARDAERLTRRPVLVHARFAQRQERESMSRRLLDARKSSDRATAAVGGREQSLRRSEAYWRQPPKMPFWPDLTPAQTAAVRMGPLMKLAGGLAYCGCNVVMLGGM